jgi:hypothetical protein
VTPSVRSDSPQNSTDETPKKPAFGSRDLAFVPRATSLSAVRHHRPSARVACSVTQAVDRDELSDGWLLQR